MGLIGNFLEAVRFVGLPAEQRLIVFYSEAREYWTHLGALLEQTLELGATGVCYLASDPQDPGLAVTHPDLQSFVTDRRHFRDWMLNSLACDVCVMTMPDLARMQVRRSDRTAHYVYAPHSMVSLQMAYRPGAFDHFDTLFCCGPHHLREARAIERQRGAPEKTLVEQGYVRLDRMREAITPGRRPGDERRVLIAPSWGEQGLIESGGEALVATLLDEGMQVTLRPHPQTTRLRPDAIAAMVARFGAHRAFELETEVNDWSSLDRADTMISDWSGAALEFALARRRPVVFLDTPRKVNNPGYAEIDMEPLEVTIREEIGVVAPPGDPAAIVASVRECIARADLPGDIAAKYLFNPGDAAQVGARHIAALVREARP